MSMCDQKCSEEIREALQARAKELKIQSSNLGKHRTADFFTLLEIFFSNGSDINADMLRLPNL